MFAGKINRHKFEGLIKRSDAVIDFGCGGGFLLKNLECGRRIGVEINPDAREHAIGLGIECYEDLSEVPDGVADVAISDHALEHVLFPIGVLRMLRRKLKPDGILAVCVPTDNWRHQRVYRRDDRNHHLHTWTVQNFGNMLIESGFEIIRLGPRTHAWPRRWTVAAYGRLPLPLFDLVCRVYAALSGNGRQVFAIARPAHDQC
jgi:SAM-dependent methyltransferase